MIIVYFKHCLHTPSHFEAEGWRKRQRYVKMFTCLLAQTDVFTRLAPFQTQNHNWCLLQMLISWTCFKPVLGWIKSGLWNWIPGRKSWTELSQKSADLFLGLWRARSCMRILREVLKLWTKIYGIVQGKPFNKSLSSSGKWRYWRRFGRRPNKATPPGERQRTEAQETFAHFAAFDAFFFKIMFNILLNNLSRKFSGDLSACTCRLLNILLGFHSRLTMSSIH